MQVPAILSQKKSIIIEMSVLIVFLAGSYYLYTIFQEESPTTTAGGAINQQLIGENLALFLKAVNQDKFSLRNTSFMDTSLVRQLRDFSEVISPNQSRGRIDPFVPYASSRPLR